MRRLDSGGTPAKGVESVDELTAEREVGVLAPRPGLEPGTLRLTAECSTIELPRIMQFVPLFGFLAVTKLVVGRKKGKGEARA